MGRLRGNDKPAAGPPRWASWLLSRFSPPGAADELQGDLLEMYAYWLKTVGVRAARWQYGLAVLRLIRPFTRSMNNQSKYYPQPSSFHPAMIRNYFKIARRNLWHKRLYTSLNIVGLAIGISAA